MAIKSAALADVVALVNETTTMPASPAIAALPAGAGEQIFVVATRPLGGSGLGFLQLPPLTTIFTTIKLGLCSLLPCLYRNLDTLVSAIRTKDSLNINIYGKSEWAHADSGASHNYMTEVKAKELQLKFKRHAGGKRIKVEVLMGTTRSTGSLKVPIGIMGEPEMDSIQEFFIVPDCVKPITMGGPWLLETKTLTQKHQYRFKASPISKSLGTILVYLLLFPFIMTGLLKIVNVFMCETAQCQATMKRLEIQLVGNDTSKPVYSIPDTGSSINCMPKSVADEMGYHIHRRWWKLTLVRNAVGHHFLADGIVEGKIRIGNFEEEHTVIWYVLKGINVHVLGRQFVKDKGVFEERYASAMKHDGGPKVHELFGLWKEPRPTAWIRHGWRKLWSRQKKEDRDVAETLTSAHNQQMARIIEADSKRVAIESFNEEMSQSKKQLSASPPLPSSDTGASQCTIHTSDAIETPQSPVMNTSHLNIIAKSQNVVVNGRDTDPDNESLPCSEPPTTLIHVSVPSSSEDSNNAASIQVTPHESGKNADYSSSIPSSLHPPGLNVDRSLISSHSGDSSTIESSQKQDSRLFNDSTHHTPRPSGSFIDNKRTIPDETTLNSSTNLLSYSSAAR